MAVKAPDGVLRICHWMLVGGTAPASSAIRRITPALYEGLPACGREAGLLPFFESYYLPVLEATTRPPDRVIVHAPHGISAYEGSPYEIDMYLLALEHPELEPLTCLSRLSEFAEAVRTLTGHYPEWYLGMPGNFDDEGWFPPGTSFYGLTQQQRKDRIKRALEPYFLVGTSGIRLDGASEQLTAEPGDLAEFTANYILSQGYEVAVEARPAKVSPRAAPYNWASNPAYGAGTVYGGWVRSDPVVYPTQVGHLSSDAEIRGRILTFNTIYPNFPPQYSPLLWPRNRADLIDSCLHAIHRGYSIALNWRDINVTRLGFAGPGTCNEILRYEDFTTDNLFAYAVQVHSPTAIPPSAGGTVIGAEDDDTPLWTGGCSYVPLVSYPGNSYSPPLPSDAGSPSEPGAGLDFVLSNEGLDEVLSQLIVQRAEVGGSRADPWIIDTTIDSFVEGTNVADIREGRVAHIDPTTGKWRLGVAAPSRTSNPVPYILLDSASAFDVIDDTAGLVWYDPPGQAPPIGAVALVGGINVTSNDFDVDLYLPGNLLTANSRGVLTKVSESGTDTVVGVVDAPVAQAFTDRRVQTLSFVAHFRPRFVPLAFAYIPPGPDDPAIPAQGPIAWSILEPEVPGGPYNYYGL